MPPKKAAATKKGDPKKDGKATPDSSGHLNNECNFKVNMEIKQEAGHYLRIKYDWWNTEAEDFEIDTGFFKDWNLIQVEGEERISPLSMTKNKSEVKKAQPAKGAPAKVSYEEISDNRPRIVNYFADFAENGIPAMKVSELIAEKFQS